MLEKMRETALSVPFVSRADSIPNLKSNRWTFAILQKKDFEAVFENDFLDRKELSLSVAGGKDLSK
jgi:hypothetical protein